ncbi:23S rRNA (pseudouridine(1915)-N(3))-methyltransferase RlmH [Anaerofilum sp. BX8]|uniref:Ribosomal RNA large subunit methyltransferase H n=1 Tax=Anaerofilum hominis TaxID=2763016 RepID=A0A923L0E2_9FIRM|nr:23S rRNA (pseudouridine(1915)-N(3))-methyltransferase RlmH [Anaerofilum hominis]MBC5580310.1 23S rRNA (pseudouridine(1915)-N(3))-methyltransferase RlmH [Anaerofilum hominis]
MQTVTVIGVGRLGQPFLQQGCAEYAKRLSAFCDLKLVELPEEMIREKAAGDAEIRRALQKEGERILAAVPKSASLVALCIEGKQLSSEELADFFQQKALSGRADVAFVIGSSHGLSDEVKARAALRLSMSRMTFPHQLARLMLLEQIYRAASINAGTRYHK